MQDNNIVTIVGCPNVGKSSLFNRLLGRRQAIVEPTSGVTRDRVYADLSWKKKNFKLVDTGGLRFSDKTDMTKAVVNQARKAIEEARLILLVLDAKVGLSCQDTLVMDFMWRFGKKIILVVNKVDDLSKIDTLGEFYELGQNDIFFVSALHGLNINHLLDGIIGELKPGKTDHLDEKNILKVAIIGRPNVGKSSFLNRILKQDRAIVDSVPGTTRDTIDTEITLGGNRIILIDTAGIRRLKKTSQNIDFYSRTRTLEAIRRSDVCLVIIDAQDGILRDDLHIFSLVEKEEKCCVIAINKCDIIEVKLKDCIDTIAAQAAFMNFAFIVLCSAKEGKNLDFALELGRRAKENALKKIKQKKLNETLHELMGKDGKQSQLHGLKVHYFTQVKTNPLTFVLIVNRPELLKKQKIRYIINGLRRRYDFQGASIRLLVKKKEQDN